MPAQSNRTPFYYFSVQNKQMQSYNTTVLSKISSAGEVTAVICNHSYTHWESGRRILKQRQ